MLNKKKILILTDWFEPGFKAGGPIQSCKNFVAALHDAYELRVITSDRDRGDRVPYPGIVADTWIGQDKGVLLYYADLQKLTMAKLNRLMDDAAPDYIYLNSMYSYSFTILPLWLKFRNKVSASVVVAPRGMLHEGAMLFKPLKKKAFILFLNRLGIPRKLVFQATDEQEKKDIGKYFPSAGKVHLAANFPKMDLVPWRQVIKHPGELHCIFISRMAPKKNLYFLLKVLQDLDTNIRLVLTLYGEVEDLAYWKKCLSVVEALPSNISVKWEGPIPNQAVTGVLQQHHVFVLPTLGENFGHAIFEALLAGKPVLVSDKTPWRELAKEKAGYDLPLEPGAFKKALTIMAGMDQSTYDEWSRAAFGYAGKIQSSASLIEEYRRIFV